MYGYTQYELKYFLTEYTSKIRAYSQKNSLNEENNYDKLIAVQEKI